MSIWKPEDKSIKIPLGEKVLASGCFTKPIEPQTLLKRVKRFLCSKGNG